MRAIARAKLTILNQLTHNYIKNYVQKKGVLQRNYD